MLNRIMLGLALCLMIVVPGLAQTEAIGEILLEGLDYPQGVFVSADGTVYVVDSGIGGDESVNFIDSDEQVVLDVPSGLTSRILSMSEDGEIEEIAFLPSVLPDETPVGASRLTELDGVLYATVGSWHNSLGLDVFENFASVVRIEDGEITPVSNLWEHELLNNSDGSPDRDLQSYPYGIVAGNDGLLYVTDSVATAIISIDPATGETSTIAGFAPGQGIASPSGIAVTDNGDVYFSTFGSSPFSPIGASIMVIYADGSIAQHTPILHPISDLQSGPDGYLYALVYGEEFIEGEIEPDTGQILRISIENGLDIELVVDGLSLPSALAFDADGNAYVTLPGEEIGDGKLLYFEDLIGMEGQSPY